MAERQDTEISDSRPIRSCPKCGRPKVVVASKGRLRYRCRECDRMEGQNRYAVKRESGAFDERPEYKGPPRYRRGGKDGRVNSSHGYVLVYVGKGHAEANRSGFVYEHRLVAAATLGRPLLPTEVVHHRDGNKQNNAPENLEVLPSTAEHAVRHRSRSDLRLPGESNPIVRCLCGCGAEFPRFDETGRPRDFASGHASRFMPSPTRDAILAVFAACPDRSLTLPEIVSALGSGYSVVAAKGVVCRAADAGVIVRLRRGVYALADAWRIEIRSRRPEGRG